MLENSSTKFTEWKKILIKIIYQHIIWFDITVKNIAALKMLQRDEKLLRVCPYSSQLKPHIRTKFLQKLTKVHVKRFKDQTQMISIHETRNKPHTMSSVFRISTSQLFNIEISCLPALYLYNQNTILPSHTVLFLHWIYYPKEKKCNELSLHHRNVP